MLDAYSNEIQTLIGKNIMFKIYKNKTFLKYMNIAQNILGHFSGAPKTSFRNYYQTRQSKNSLFNKFAKKKKEIEKFNLLQISINNKFEEIEELKKKKELVVQHKI